MKVCFHGRICAIKMAIWVVVGLFWGGGGERNWRVRSAAINIIALTNSGKAKGMADMRK